MGCILSIWTSRSRNTHKCLQHLNQVDRLLHEMLAKYGREMASLTEDIRSDIAYHRPKHGILSKMRKKKILMHYISQCERRTESIVGKRYALEQLELTAMQIEAMKSSTTVLKKFTKTHNITKLEELQSTMEDLQADVMDIDDLLSTETMSIDEDELEEELKKLSEQPHIISTVAFPTVPEDEYEPLLKQQSVCI
jgi:hypothetical protein